MRSTTLLYALAITSFHWLCPADAGAQNHAGARALELGAPVSDSLVPGSTHRWTLELNKNDYARVQVEQLGVDLVARVLDPAGNLTAEFDSPTGNTGNEAPAWIAGVAGQWTVELEPFEGSPAGGYTIEWKAGRPATEEERLLQEADSLALLGYSLLEQGGFVLENRDEGDSAGAVTGTTLLSRALEIRLRFLPTSHPDIDLNLTMLGSGYRLEGRFADAERAFRTALEYREANPETTPVDLVFSLRLLGSFYGSEGRFDEAAPMIRRALDLQMEAFGPDDPTVAALMQELARIHQEQGRYTEAEPLFERSLQIMEAALGPEDTTVATFLSNLGTFRQDLGQLAQAEALYRRALEIREKKLGESYDLAVSLNNLGALFHQQGRHAEAEELFRRSLAIREKVLGPEHVAVATALGNLGNLLSDVERYAEAEQLLRRALAIREDRGGTSRALAIDLNNLGVILDLQGMNSEAAQLLERALEVTKSSVGEGHPRVAVALFNLAKIALEEKEPERALDLTSRAIRILDNTVGRPDMRVKAYSLRSRILKVTGDSEGAITDLEEALRSAEELRPQTGGGEEVRAAYFAQYADAFDRMVEWQLEAGQTAEAFEYAERGRARVLLDQLAAGRIDIRAGIPPEQLAQLEAREMEAKGRLAHYQQRITVLRGRQDLSTGKRMMTISALEDSLRSADAEYRRIYGELKNASPLWKDLITSGGQPVSLATVQRELVPDSGAVLLYQIGGEASFLFFIPGPGEEAVGLALEVTDGEAGVLGVAAGPLTEPMLDSIMAGGLLQELQEPGGTDVIPVLHALWSVLIPEEVRDRVLASPEVVIVPDARLHQFPFEALVVDVGRSAYWLDAGPVVRYVASATTLYNLARRQNARSFGPSRLLSVSDPVFDPSAAGAARAAPAPTVARTRNAYQRVGGSLAPLPGTARETAAIKEAFEDDRTVSVIALQGGEATEANVRDAMGEKRYLHLATHGLVDEKRGALFAALAFTPPPPGQTPTGANDGFLQLFEIYDLELSGTNLAVLSACESSIGEQVEGEGVFALSRGFFAAGAERVVASLWAVDDASTAALMAEFFRQIAAAEQAGRKVDYAVALRDAKRVLIAEARWNSPYYWAPFILAGPS